MRETGGRSFCLPFWYRRQGDGPFVSHFGIMSTSSLLVEISLSVIRIEICTNETVPAHHYKFIRVFDVVNIIPILSLCLVQRRRIRNDSWGDAAMWTAGVPTLAGGIPNAMLSAAGSMTATVAAAAADISSLVLGKVSGESLKDSKLWGRPPPVVSAGSGFISRRGAEIGG